MQKLWLDSNDPSVVKARITVQQDIAIKEDTRARLVLTGLTGASVIGLSGGSPDSPELPQPETGDPVIVASTSPITQLLANSDNLMTNLTSLVMSAQQVLSAQNAKRIGNSLKNIELVTESMAAQTGSMTELIEAVTRASKQAETTMAQATVLINNTDALLEKQGAATMQSVQRAMVSLETTGKSLDQLINENRAGLSSGVDGLRQLGPALQELRGTLAGLQDVIRKLDDNPANFLLGRTTVEEFEP